ncbi:glycosyltransferase [Rhodovulum steppense]|uniref:Glycosyltransferase involved in cell wall biosynthesis n=1 Tax=Rhodovulum steppense TaxID=540251 RepID=A0A4R1YMJ3_9RHOB|nr:glycosyltransferase [Rhodovulum steppense]TCM78970.1 glycosyltransferase involved in cell wall biosynthesis [Rhodovulum steppense]
MIQEPYTLFTRIPLFENSGGVLYTDRLWAKDLLLHLDYLPGFRICCPLLPRTEGTKADTPLPGLSRKQVFALRLDRGWGSVFANLMPNFLTVLRAARQGGILHTSGAGWAFPLGYYLLPLRPVLAFRWVMVIESSFWMAPENGRARFRARLAERLHRTLIRRCLKTADARIFTQDWYRETLFGGTENCLIAPATWIDDSAILDAANLAPRTPGALRLICPTRLEQEKGVETLMAAVTAYEAMPDCPPLMLDIMGSGAMAERVKTFVAAHRGAVEMRFLEPLPYGAPFFQLLRRYDGVVIANRTEEQPRIAFDAFSQGLPCLASRTNGNASVIEESRTGLFFTPGDGTELATRLAELAAAPEAFAQMRPAALAAARRHTHEEMHRTRERFLRKALELKET